MGLPLAYSLGIVLGCLIIVAFGAGLIKLYINKRRLQINQKTADEAAAKSTDREKLVGNRNLREGDLFGVRAIEHGYFGGVAQSRSSSPAPSYKLAPGAKLVNWGEANKLRSDSSSVASSNFDIFQQANSSASSVRTGTTMRKPSPLRLQPINTHTKVHNMSSVGNMGGNFMPPPSPRSIKAAPSIYEGKEKSTGWVSPLDVHFSRPTTPARPVSFLPKLHFPLEFGNSDLSVPLPDLNGAKSESASIVESVIVKPSPVSGARVQSPREIYAEFSQQGSSNSPTLSSFSHQNNKSPTTSTLSRERTNEKSFTSSVFLPQAQAPPRPNRLSIKSLFSTDAPTLRSPRSPKEDFSKNFQLPALPLQDLTPRIPPINPSRWNASSPLRDTFAQQQAPPSPMKTKPKHEHDHSLPSIETEIKEWQPSEQAVIGASIASKQRVSIIRGRSAQSQDLSSHLNSLPDQQATDQTRDGDQHEIENRAKSNNTAAASTYSTQTSSSILSVPSRHPSPPPPHTHPKAVSRTRSRSSSARAYSRNSRSLSRTRDSVERRDNPRNASRSSERSWVSREQPQGLSFAFQPKQTENPFSKSTLNLIPSPFSNDPSSSPTSEPPHPPLPPRFFPPQDTDRLSIFDPQHKKSISNVSQNSIGEFYDSYYRQSTMGSGRASSGDRQAGARNSVQDRAQLFGDKDREASRERGRKPPPAPLRYGTAAVGLGGIREVASPLSSPLVATGTKETFPSMI